MSTPLECPCCDGSGLVAPFQQHSPYRLAPLPPAPLSVPADGHVCHWRALPAGTARLCACECCRGRCALRRIAPWGVTFTTTVDCA